MISPPSQGGDCGFEPRTDYGGTAQVPTKRKVLKLGWFQRESEALETQVRILSRPPVVPAETFTPLRAC